MDSDGNNGFLEQRFKKAKKLYEEGELEECLEEFQTLIEIEYRKKENLCFMARAYHELAELESKNISCVVSLILVFNIYLLQIV